MTTIESTNQDMYQTIADDASITVLEKQVGRTTTTDISEALEEYKRLFKAGIASPAETLTLSRAYPNDAVYKDAASRIEKEPVVVGGPASVSLIDREGHLITTDALEKAFKQYMSNFRTRNTMVLHSDVQVGWALPAYISKSGDVFKSGVDDKGLFFVTELRDDTKIAKKVLDQIDDGKLKSYSIAGSATKTQNKTKGLMPYMQVDEMELAEITVCERGVNQAASFDILKGHDAATQTCTDGSCLMDHSTPTPKEPLDLIIKADGNIDFVNSFAVWVEKGPLVNIAQRALGGAKKVERGATAAMSTPRRVGAGVKAATSSIIGRATTTKKGERQRAKSGLPAKRPAQGAIGSAISGFKATPPSDQAMQRAKRISSIKSSNAQKGSTSPATVTVHFNVSDGSAAQKYMASRASSGPSLSSRFKSALPKARGAMQAYRAKTKQGTAGHQKLGRAISTFGEGTYKPKATSTASSAASRTSPAIQRAKKTTSKYPRPSMSSMGGGSKLQNRQLRLLDYDLEKAAFLAPLAAIGRTAATGVGRAASAGSKKAGQMAMDYGKRKAKEKIEEKISSVTDKLFGSKKEKMVDTNLSLLADFVAKANYTPGAGKKSPMAAPEAKPNIGKIKHEQHDQDQSNSENAFKLQEKETDVVFNKESNRENLASKQQKVFEQVTRDYNKDEDIEKQEDNLVTEYSTNEIQTEKDTDLVMADSNVPSTPSMGWFDMLKQELKADVLTDIEMTKAYPDWRQDPEAYSEHWAIMKNKITEGYK